MKRSKVYKIMHIREYATKHRLLNIYFYNLYNSKTVYYKELKPHRLKIEIDGYTGEITAYKKRREYTSRWTQVKVKRRWIKELKYLIHPENFVGDILYDK